MPGPAMSHDEAMYSEQQQYVYHHAKSCYASSALSFALLALETGL